MYGYNFQTVRWDRSTRIRTTQSFFSYLVHSIVYSTVAVDCYDYCLMPDQPKPGGSPTCDQQTPKHDPSGYTGRLLELAGSTSLFQDSNVSVLFS